MRYVNGVVILMSSLSYAIVAGALAAVLLLCAPAEVQEAPVADTTVAGTLGGSLSDPTLGKPANSMGR